MATAEGAGELTLHSVARGVVRGYVLADAHRPLIGQDSRARVFGTADQARDAGASVIAAGRVVVLELREVEAR